MGLVVGLVDQARRWAAATPQSGACDGQERWAGPDDIFPEEDPVIVDSSPPPPPPLGELVVTKQWGLVLPGGDVAWNSWQGVPFDNPMDRLHMIAKLQATANDVGWHQDEFLARYGWATRNQLARVLYEGTGSYDLTDSAASQPEDLENAQKEES